RELSDLAKSDEKSNKQLARELNAEIGKEKHNKTSFANFQKIAKSTDKANRPNVWLCAYNSLCELRNTPNNERTKISDIKKHHEAEARKFVNK
ncbi:MAG TPA: hypothetical protein PLD88_03465, partial [Candidatus Berkiella sp.]|nr:hypothetical protein [Candidatus Berkiella sp.]